MREPINIALTKLFENIFGGDTGSVSDLISDKIRFLRWRSGLKTLERAREIAESQNRKLSQPEIKFLVPFMEGCSLEPESSDGLRDMWAKLLVSEGTVASSRNLSVIKFLSIIGESEAACLRDIGYRTVQMIDPHGVMRLGHNINEIVGRFISSSGDTPGVMALTENADSRLFSKISFLCHSFHYTHKGAEVRVRSPFARSMFNEIAVLEFNNAIKVIPISLDYVGAGATLYLIEISDFGKYILEACGEDFNQHAYTREETR